MKKESRNKYLIKNTLIFSIGNFGSKLITFFLVPFYTNILTVEEYGTIDLVTTVGTILLPIISLNISEAVMRFSMDKNSDDRQIINIGFLFFLIACAISLVMIPAFAFWNITSNFSTFLSLYLISMTSSTIFMCYVRGKEELLFYSVMGLVQTFLIAILNILFLVKFSLGIKGYLLSYIISHFIVSFAIIIKENLIKKVSFKKLDKKVLKDMLKYSILLIPNSLMWWIMNSLDKVMVTYLINIESNGIYAVSYKIPSIVITFTTIFNQAWLFSAVKEKESKDKNEYTNSVYNSLNFAITLSTVLLLFILKPLMKVYVGESFYEAWRYVPPLLIGTLFLTLGSFIANEYSASKDSNGFLKSSIIGAVLNVILNSILIPKIGIMGASLATCVSYIGVFIYRIDDTKKYVKIKYLTKNKIMNFIILLVMAISTYVNQKYVIIIQLFLIIFVIFANRGSFQLIYKKIFNKIITKKEVSNDNR